MLGWLLVLHLLAAIAVIGPAFVVPVIRWSARTADQFRFAFEVTNKFAFLPKIGGSVLIVTGVWMMIITKMGLSQMWLNISILLLLLVIATLDGLIEPRIKKIMQIVSISQGIGDEVPAELARLMKKMVPIELASLVMMIAITVLMVLKPF